MNDNSGMCDSISQIGHVLALIGLGENFTVRAPNCCWDDKHHRTRLKRSIRGVSEHFAKKPSFKSEEDRVRITP